MEKQQLISADIDVQMCMFPWVVINSKQAKSPGSHGISGSEMNVSYVPSEPGEAVLAEGDTLSPSEGGVVPLISGGDHGIYMGS